MKTYAENCDLLKSAAWCEGSVQDWRAAFKAVADAQRTLAEARDLGDAIPFDVGGYPEAVVSGAVLLQTEYATYLTFNAMRVGPNGMRHDAGTAVVEILGCLVTRFGYPNDEARSGHPLYTRGLSGYGVFEVRNSRWIRTLNEWNRIRFPAASNDSRQIHFFISFHDSSFECIADSLKVTLTSQPQAEVFASITPRAFRSPPPDPKRNSLA